jgi:hypothetical protein
MVTPTMFPVDKQASTIDWGIRDTGGYYSLQFNRFEGKIPLYEKYGVFRKHHTSHGEIL